MGLRKEFFEEYKRNLAEFMQKIFLTVQQSYILHTPTTTHQTTVTKHQ